MIKKILLIIGAILCSTALASAEEFTCPEGAKASGNGPGTMVRWCVDDHNLYHGPVWRWHRNGRLESKEYYLHGNAEGETPSWYENGKPSSLGLFKNGTKSGLWKYWDDSGRIETEVTYHPAGNFRTEYYPSGRIKAVGIWTSSGKIGSWTYWDQVGNEKSHCDFGDGLLKLPNKACAIIAEELEPKGYSRPIPAGLKTKNGNAAIRIASQTYDVTTPAGWIVDLEAGKTNQTPLVFYPKSGTWRGSNPNMYIRPVFKEGRSFDQVMANEEEGFRENVAQYEGKLSGGGKITNDKTYITTTITYKPILQTDSPFAIVSGDVIHETVGFVDISDDVVLMIVLAGQSTEQMKDASPCLSALINSLSVEPTKGKAQ